MQGRKDSSIIGVFWIIISFSISGKSDWCFQWDGSFSNLCHNCILAVKISQHMDRRKLLKLSGTSMGLAFVGGLVSCNRQFAASRILQKNDTINLNGAPEEFIQKAYELGFKYEKEYRGCARCTVAALQDALPFVAKSEELFRGSTCLDGGATPTNMANCGAFTGSGMVIAYVCGSTRDEAGFYGDNKLAHELIHKVHAHFVKEYGSVICADVRKASGKDCPEVVGRAAMCTSRVMIEEFS
jgi:hypothetical protein